MKKLLKSLLVTGLIASLCVPSFANTIDSGNSKRVTFSANEITDESILEKRIELGITDDADFKLNKDDLVNTFTDNGVISRSEIKSIKATVQKLKVEEDKNSTTTKYVANILADVECKEGKLSEVGLRGTGMNEPDPVWDSSGYNAKVWLRVYYDEYMQGTYPIDHWYLRKFTTIEGKFTIYDSQVTPKELTYYEYTWAPKYSDSNAQNYLGITKYTHSSTSTSNLTSYSTEIDSYEGLYSNVTDPVGLSNAYMTAKVKGKLQRGGTTWYTPEVIFTIDN